MSLVGSFLRIVFERRAAGKSMATLYDNLEAAKERTAERIACAPDTRTNRDQARHIIGIERWSTRRLNNSLENAAPVMDECDDYQPDGGLSMVELAREFLAAREETLAAAEPLKANGQHKRMIWHNQFGSMSEKAWLAYIQSHTDMEVRKLR